jgi:hypothetical protein
VGRFSLVLIFLIMAGFKVEIEQQFTWVIVIFDQVISKTVRQDPPLYAGIELQGIGNLHRTQVIFLRK